MRKSITVEMTPSFMITYLGTYPIFERTEENIKDAIDLSNKVLALVIETEDEPRQIGMMAVTYLVAEFMELTEILDHIIIKEFIEPQNGQCIKLPSDEVDIIKELAIEDYRGYIEWISPFLTKAGVDDVESELKDIDAIQDAIMELAYE